MLLLTESTLYWVNLHWNISTPNRRAVLVGCINNWPTIVSSAVSEATPAYKKIPMPVSSGLLDEDGAHLSLYPTNTTINSEESDDKFIKPISEAAQTSSKCKHRDYTKAGYVVMSEVDEVDDVGSDVGYDIDILQQTEKVFHVTAMTNITVDQPAKKLQISQHGDTMVEQSGKSAVVSTISSQFSSAGANSTGTGGRHVHYINRHLPPMLQEDRKWTKLILSALLSNLNEICPRAPIFVLATQQLGVWQSNFGSTAITLVAHFLASDSDNTQSLVAVQQMCIKLLDGEGVSIIFFLHLLAHAHLHPCTGCPDIPRLNTNGLKEHGVKGAMALCCSALEHVIHLFYKGEVHVNDQISTCGRATMKTPLKSKKGSEKEPLTILAFSDQNWGSCTRQYFISVARCDATALKEVITMANALVTPVDSMMSEDGSLGDLMVEDLNMSTDQHMSIFTSCTFSFHAMIAIYTHLIA
ncbi:hypothetical protein V8B97DRAFT_2024679 [Scleroderma yunnanense]